jgi:hypothetical protein
VSNAARLAIPGTGDDGKVPYYNEATDAWLLSGAPAAGDVIRPEDFGTINGTDDYDEVQAAFDALTDGDTLLFTAGVTYAHDTKLYVEQLDSVTVKAHGATILATNEADSVVWFEQMTNLLVEGGTYRLGSNTGEGSNTEYNKMLFGTCSNWVLRDVLLEGGKATNLFIATCSGFVLDGVVARRSMRDSIHITGNSRYGRLIDTHSIEGGDDGVAIVSYTADLTACHHIDIIRAKVSGQTSGRGITVVGGHDVNIIDPDVYRSNGAGIYIAIEDSDFTTFPVSDVNVHGGRLSRCNTNSGLDHGAIILFSENSAEDIVDVDIAEVEIFDTLNGGNVVQLKNAAGAGGGVTGITLTNLTYNGSNPGSGSYGADSGLTATATNVVRRTY